MNQTSLYGYGWLLMNNHIIMLPGDDFQRVKNREITRAILPASKRLRVKLHDWINIVFKDTKDNVLVEIEDINFTLFKNLNSNTAAACGFDSVKELKNSLVESYPTLDNNSRLYIYSFFVVGFSEKITED